MRVSAPVPGRETPPGPEGDPPCWTDVNGPLAVAARRPRLAPRPGVRRARSPSSTTSTTSTCSCQLGCACRGTTSRRKTGSFATLDDAHARGATWMRGGIGFRTATRSGSAASCHAFTLWPRCRATLEEAPRWPTCCARDRWRTSELARSRWKSSKWCWRWHEMGLVRTPGRCERGAAAPDRASGPFTSSTRRDLPSGPGGVSRPGYG